MSSQFTRRELLSSMAASWLASTAGPQMKPKWIDNMGVELYTVRSLLTEKARETIEAVAAIGYRHCEIQDVMTLARLAMSNRITPQEIRWRACARATSTC